MEDQRHQQLMDFMSSFPDSVEWKIKETNSKFDTKMEEINCELKYINDKIDRNDDKAHGCTKEDGGQTIDY